MTTTDAYLVYRYGRKDNYGRGIPAHAVRAGHPVCGATAPGESVEPSPDGTPVTCRRCLLTLGREGRDATPMIPETVTRPKVSEEATEAAIKRPRRSPMDHKPHGVFFRATVGAAEDGEVLDRAALAGLVLLRVIDSWAAGPLPPIAEPALQKAIWMLPQAHPHRAVLARILGLLRYQPANDAGEALDVLTALGQYAGQLYRDRAWPLAADVCRTIARVANRWDHRNLLPHVAELLGYCYAMLGRDAEARMAWQTGVSWSCSADDGGAFIELERAEAWLTSREVPHK